jgi:hypothetical protein
MQIVHKFILHVQQWFTILNAEVTTARIEHFHGVVASQARLKKTLGGIKGFAPRQYGNVHATSGVHAI